MGTVDDIVAQRAVERAERRKKREDLEKLLHDMRAQQFSRQVALLSKFVPDACMDDAHEELMLNAIGIDVEIIVQVPPDRDAQDAERMKQAMMRAPAPVIVPKTEQ